MKKWRVVVCEGNYTWEHVDLSEEEAERIVASCPPTCFAYMTQMGMFDYWRRKQSDGV